jgi:hypothetical protein
MGELDAPLLICYASVAGHHLAWWPPSAAPDGETSGGTVLTEDISGE